jgi:DNA-binding transcriptional ArsR family regulator
MKPVMNNTDPGIDSSANNSNQKDDSWWVPVSKGFMRQKGIKPREREVLILLHLYGDGGFPSMARLAEDLDTSISTIKRVIKRLLEMGLITKEWRPFKSNIYTLRQELSTTGVKNDPLEGDEGSKMTPTRGQKWPPYGGQKWTTKETQLKETHLNKMYVDEKDPELWIAKNGAPEISRDSLRG